ncbi:MAG: lactonase family protein [Rhodospirillaceae bacterium]|nr:lactonase family protein [Rhodospirillaceae bacterium]MBT5666493.1 lactonase family protein [Rhodospirillaceae bacterium]
MTYHVYVTVMGEGRIARFSMDEDTGALTPGVDVALSGRPAPIALSPDRRVMHVARREANKITSYAIESGSGNLTELGTIPIDSDPCYMATDRTGRYLLSAYYLAETAAVHGVDDNGAAIYPPIEWLHTGRGAHCFQTDRSNKFAFVPHIDGNGAPNAIFQFRFDDATGRLIPNDPPRMLQKVATGPRHFCFHPTMDIVYVSNEQGCGVSVYAFDATAGTLGHRQTISTLPEEWLGVSKCSQIQITPCGRYVYAPNRGHNSIAEFAVNDADGLLSAIGHVEAETAPRAFAIDPAGKFLLSAGLESGRLATYRIDGGSGRLERIATRDLGESPMWVTIIPAT